MKNTTKHTRRRKNILLSAICAVAAFLLVWLLVLSEIMPKKFDLQEGVLADTDIRATMDVTDELATQEARAKARASVADIYSIQEKAGDDIRENVLAALNSVKELVGRGGDSQEIPLTETLLSYGESYLYFLGEEARTDTTVIRLLLSYDEGRASNINTYVSVQLDEVLAEGIRDRDAAAAQLSEKLKTYFGEEYATEGGKAMINTVIGALNAFLKVTSTVDTAATEEAKEAAAAAVPPVSVKKGEILVHSGEIVTANHIRMLSALGLLNDGKLNLKLILGSAALLLVLFALMALYVVVYQPEMIENPRQILLFCVLICLSLLISVLAKSASLNTMLMQVSIGTMLIAILLHARLALVANLALSVILGMLISDDSGLFGADAIILSVTSIVAGTSAVYMCSKPMYRGRIFFAGLVIGFTAAATSTTMGMLISGMTVKDVLYNALWCLAGGLLTSIVCVGTMPVWEATFKVLTPTKLLEISNSNSALQRRLALEIPGTYHHSIVVSNLSEAAAEMIGANVLLVRAGALYHDIGKLRIPECFSENQTETTRGFHDLLSPEESAKMIISHVTEGVELAKKYKLPREVIDIIRQHHGTSRTEYFYQKALEENPEASPAVYTYPGPKPQTKEAAIILLADGVEASVRSLQTNDRDEVNRQLRKMIQTRISSGELNECALTLAEIEEITEAFTQVLSGVYHERIKYPGQKGTSRKEQNDRDS